jgi:hypothetical protein
MGAGTVIFEGVGSKPKRNRGPQKARSIAEIVTLGKLARTTTLYVETKRQAVKTYLFL